MYYGAELGQAIVANRGEVEAALLAYEQDLFPRSASEANQRLELGDFSRYDRQFTNQY
jgi:hypothetical protein